MQPYQEASEEINRQAGSPIRALKTAGSLIGGTAIAGKIIPFLSRHIPGELMRKGLSKIEPRLGKFVEGALNNGYSIDDVRNFIGEKFSPKEEQTKKSQSPLQDFEKNYPDLAQAYQNQINKGIDPQAAAAILKNSNQLSKRVNELEKAIGKNFVDYILEIYGNSQSQGQQQQAQPQSQSPMQQVQNPQQAQNQGVNPQLMQIMNGIRSAMQNLSGGGP